MFGMLKPCAHSAAKYGMAATSWQTQLCGLCLGLRDGHGQLARAATNTDALVLGILTEAQQPHTAVRTEAGPCPLRGMRKASVAAADSPGVRLAATASLLLGAARIRDHIDDGDTRRAGRLPMTRVANRWHTGARAAAAPIGLDIEPLIAAIESQPRRERAAVSGSLESLDELTWPTQLCASELFAHTAVLAGRPENTDALREAGWHFGRIAHLADALEDIDEDREAGRFNPLTATGTGTADAHALLRESNSLLKAALTRVGLERNASIRWMLLDPLNAVVRKLGKAAGTIHTCTTHACGTRPSAESAEPAAWHAWQSPRHPGMFLAGIHTAAVDPGQKRAGMTGGGPHTAIGPQAVFGVEPPQTPTRRPGFWEGIGIGVTQYCTGYACCSDHTRPCSGERKESWLKRDCCDCGDCCDCTNCCSCDCGDCDCGCCDCSC
ncbi:regulator [Nocardia sp. SYP-A9097]|nr:regulator [Nocardia sp. SYP-A9097]